jgi:hypothetical protein
VFCPHVPFATISLTSSGFAMLHSSLSWVSLLDAVFVVSVARQSFSRFSIKFFMLAMLVCSALKRAGAPVSEIRSPAPATNLQGLWCLIFLQLLCVEEKV